MCSALSGTSGTKLASFQLDERMGVGGFVAGLWAECTTHAGCTHPQDSTKTPIQYLDMAMRHHQWHHMHFGGMRTERDCQKLA